MLKEIIHRIKIRENDPQRDANTGQGASIRAQIASYIESRDIITDFRAEVEHERTLRTNWIIDHAEDEIGTDRAVIELTLLTKILAMTDGREDDISSK